MPPQITLEDRKARFKEEVLLQKKLNEFFDGKVISQDYDTENINQMIEDLKKIREEQVLSDLKTRKTYQQLDPEMDQGDVNRISDKVLLQIFSKEIIVNKYGKDAFPEDGNQYMQKMATELASEDNDVIDDPLPDQEDPLKRILQDVYYYSGLNMTANSLDRAARDILLMEGRLAKRIYRRLNTLFDEMNRQNDEANEKHTGNYVDDDRMFVVSNLLNYYQAELFGKLGSVPEQPNDQAAIHIMYTGKYMGVKVLEEMMAKNQSKYKDCNMTEDYRKQPLFPHEPSPQDIQQAQIGDCYFLATLAEIAERRPEKIKEMMIDNNDGTVTVRFYHRAGNDPENPFEPFTVTVDKVRSRGQAHASLWVQTMERALAVSGMMQSAHWMQDRSATGHEITDPNYAPHPHLEDPPDFEGVRGGNAQFAQELLLGNDVHWKNHITDTSGYGPLNDKDVKPIAVGKVLKGDAKKFTNLIKEGLKKGNLLTCGSLSTPERTDHKCPCGINKKHEYTIMGIVPKELKGSDGNMHTHYFVKLRNPHGESGRDYRLVKGKLEAFSTANVENKKTGIFGIAGDNNGIAYVEMNHFVNEFSDVCVAEVKPSSVERKIHIANEEKNVVKSYNQALKEINKYLDNNISFFSSNSDEYKDMKKAFNTIAGKPPKSYVELEDQLAELSAYVIKYQKHAKEITGDPKLRRIKANACNAFYRVLDARKKGYMRPNAYARGLLADKVMDAFMKQDQTGLDPQQVQQVKDKITKDPGHFRIALMRTPMFTGWMPHYKSIMAISLQLDNKAKANIIRPDSMDPSLVTPETKTLNEIRRSMGLIR